MENELSLEETWKKMFGSLESRNGLGENFYEFKARQEKMKAQKKAEIETRNTF